MSASTAVYWPAAQASSAFDAVVGAVGGEPDQIELAHQHLAVDRMIVDHQHAEPLAPRAQRVRLGRGIGPQQGRERRIRRRGLERQRHREGRALAGRALDVDAAVHQLGQPPHDGKAEAGAAESPRGRGIGLRERLEQPRPLLVAQADAGVAHRQRDARRAVAERARRGAHLDAALVGELQRVGQQVEQDLPHPRRIADQRVVRAGGDVGFEQQSLGGRLRAERVERAGDQAGQRERGVFQLEPAGLDLGEVEQVVDDAQQRLRRIAHGRHALALLLVQALVLENLHHAEHAVHRRADLVAHGGEEGRFGLGRGFGLGARGLGGLLGGGERRLALAQLGDVVIDAEQAAVLELAEDVFDVAAAVGAPLVAVAAGLAHPARRLRRPWRRCRASSSGPYSPRVIV